MFNVFNTVIYNDRNRNVIYRSPTDLTIVNSQYLADVRSNSEPSDAENRRFRRCHTARSRSGACCCRFGSGSKSYQVSAISPQG
jgi:hypothetical protein